MKVKTNGFYIKRKDLTVPMTKEEEKIAEAKHVDDYRIPRTFRVLVNAAVPFHHRMYTEEK